MVCSEREADVRCFAPLSMTFVLRNEISQYHPSCAQREFPLVMFQASAAIRSKRTSRKITNYNLVILAFNCAVPALRLKMWSAQS
jgi:hypothetical protein